MSIITNHIESFVAHFTERISSIAALASDNYLPDFQKTLYVAIIDGMSKSVFPRRPNRDRFVSFVAQFSQWTNGSRLSLPHLVKLLSLVPDPQFEDARKFARNLLTNWMPGEIKHLEDDLEVDQIIPIWPTGKLEMRILHGVSLLSIQHYHLMYSYRNSLVHEFKSSGFPIEEFDEMEPHYFHLTRNADSLLDLEHVWQLNYPERFFQLICEQCLASLRDYLHSNMIDPIDIYTEGSYFLEELNA
jgi:hypothetical protein